MKRKLVQLGKNCLMAAIPMKWLKQQGLGKGDAITLEEVENYLLVSAKPLPRDEERTITIAQNSRAGTVRTLQLLYDSGIQKLNVSFSTPIDLKNIMFAVNWLDSWRIVDSSKNACTIETIENENFNFENHFRKTFLNVKELTHLFSRYLKGERELLEEIRMTYELAFRGTMELKRHINTSKLPLEYKYYYFIAVQFEEMADHYEFLLRYLEKPSILPKTILPLQKKLEKMMEEAYTNFYTFELDIYLGATKELVWKMFEIDEEPSIVYHLRAISERIKNIMKYTVGIRIR